MNGWRFEHSEWLTVLAVVPVLVLLLEVRLGGGRARILTRTATRSLLLGLLVVALAQPVEERTDAVPPHIVVTLEALPADATDARVEMRALVSATLEEAARRGWPVSTVRDERGGAALRSHDRQGRLPDAPVAGDEAGRPDRALAAAAAAFSEGDAGGVLVLTAGRAGLGEAARRATALAARGVRVGYIPVPAQGRLATTGPRVASLQVPGRARGRFNARARVEHAAGRDVVWTVDGDVVARASVPTDDEGQGADLMLDIEPLAEGLHEIALVIGGGDGAPEVITRQVVEAPPTPRIAGRFADPALSLLARSAEAQGLELVAWEDGTPLPARVVAVAGDAAGLGALGSAELNALANAVRDGLGLVVEGGDDEAAWAALAATPLAAVLPVTPLAALPPPAPAPVPPPAAEPPTPPPPPIDPPKPAEGPGLVAVRQPDLARPITLLLVIDRSGSMDGEKFKMALEAARRAAAALGASDRVGVILFAEEAKVAMAPRGGRPDLSIALGFAQADGNETNIHAALAAAGQLMALESSPIRHVLLLTDGEQHPPGPLFHGVMRPLRDNGVTVTAVGIGRGARMSQLREIVKGAAGGAVLYAPTAADVPTVVTRDTERVAEARADQVEELNRVRDPDAHRDPTPTPDEPAEPPRRIEQPPTQPPPEPLPLPALPVTLRPVRAHEALVGWSDATWPAVGRPRRARTAPAAAVLLERADEEAAAVLVAGRPGLGRAAVFLLPPDDRGWNGWEQGAAVLAQVLASVAAPEGTAEHFPTLALVEPAGEAPWLEVRWPAGVTSGRLGLTWAVDGGAREALAMLRPSPRPQRVPLAAVQAGQRLQIRPTLDGRPLPALERVLAPRTPRPWPAADAAALAQALGPPVASPAAFIAALPWGERRREVPRWAWAAIAALAWLLVDVAAHRRRGTA